MMAWVAFLGGLKTPSRGVVFSVANYTRVARVAKMPVYGACCRGWTVPCVGDA